MAAQRRLRGFTLIELLISITILGLVIGLSTYGFSLFSRHWEGPKSGFERASGQMQRLDLVSRALNDALPWLVRNDSGRPGFYFLGRDEGLTLVTSSPIFAVGSPAVIRVFREPDGSGAWRLVYEEASLATLVLRDATQTLPFDRRLIILEGVKSITFRFYGWASVEERLGSNDIEGGVAPRWWDEFDGIVRMQQPKRVSLTLGGFEAIFQMPERTDTLLNRVSPMT